MKIPLSLKAVAALMAFACCTEAVRAQELQVNKYSCSERSYTTTLPPADPDIPGGPSVSTQCSNVLTAVLNGLVVYFVTITNRDATNPGPVKLVDVLPSFFHVVDVLCAGFGGASTGTNGNCKTSYSGGATLTLSGLTIPNTGGSSIVIEIEGFFTVPGDTKSDFDNCATGTPSTSTTNSACKLVTVPMTPAPWDLSLSKTFTQTGPNTFHTQLTLTNDSPNKQTVYLTNFLQLLDRLNINTTPIPAIQYTLANFVCNSPATSTCPTNVPTTSTTGMINTSSKQTTLIQLLWQQAYPNQGFIAFNDNITIEFDLTFAPTCEGGSLAFSNEAFLALYRNGNSLNDNNNNNTMNNNDVFVPSSSTFLTYTYAAGPACPFIIKSATPSSSVPWSTGVVAYTITVNNPTSSTVTINIVDQISKAAITPPFKLNVTSGPTCTPTTGSSCGPFVPSTVPPTNFTNSSPQTIFSVPATLIANGSTTVSFNATFTNLDTCEVANGNLDINNTASMTATFSAGGTLVRDNTVTITMAPLPDCPLSITKTVDSTQVTFGTPITYTVTYTNTSSLQSVKVSTLRDVLTVNNTYGPFVVTVNSITCNSLTPSGNTLTLFGGSLTTNTSVPVPFQSRGWAGNPIFNLNSGSQMAFPPNGQVSCTIVVTPQQPPANASCSGNANLVNGAYFDQGILPFFQNQQPLFYKPVALPLPTCQRLQIQKILGNPSASPGGPVTFTIVVGNSGPTAVSGVTLTDPMPPGFTIASIVSCTPCSTAPTTTGNVLKISPLDTLPPGGSVTVVLLANASIVGGSYQNVAAINFPSQANVYNSGGNSSNEVNIKVQTPVLAKAFGSSAVTSGGQSLLTFTITNPFAAANGLQFTDNLPTGLKTLTTPAPTTTCGGSVQISADGSAITFTNGNIAGSTGSGPAPSCTITVAVQATPCGALVNQWSATAANSNLTDIKNLDPTGASATLTVRGNCPPEGATPVLEICKVSSTVNPVPPNAIYNFTVSGSAFNSSENPVMVPVGGCSGPIRVAGPTAATVTELPTLGVGVSGISATGYSPPPLSAQGNLLESFNLQNRTGIVMLRTPGSPDDFSLQTVVIFTDYTPPTAQLKVCKIAGSNVPPGTVFTFTLSPIPGASPGFPPITTTVQAGPVTQGGFCALIPGTFQVGASVTVTETLPAGYVSPPATTVNGASAPSAGCTPGSNGSLCSVVAVIGAGVNEVSFTNNRITGRSETTLAARLLSESSAAIGLVEIVDYAFVSEAAATGTKRYVTYRADLLNLGNEDLGPLTVSLNSLDASLQVVGQGALEFPPTPANGRVTSGNTFSLLIDPSVPLDFSKLKWKFRSSRSLAPVK